MWTHAFNHRLERRKRYGCTHCCICGDLCMRCDGGRNVLVHTDGIAYARHNPESNCSCIGDAPSGTMGTTCAYHATTDTLPWCYVNASCAGATDDGFGWYKLLGCSADLENVGVFRPYISFPGVYRIPELYVSPLSTVYISVQRYADTSAHQIGDRVTLYTAVSTQSKFIQYNSRVYGRINYVADIDDYHFWGARGDVIQALQHPCCLSGFVSYIDFDILAPNGTVIAGAGTQDRGTFLHARIYPPTGTTTTEYANLESVCAP